jgi:hypothetical protein
MCRRAWLDPTLTGRVLHTYRAAAVVLAFDTGLVRPANHGERYQQDNGARDRQESPIVLLTITTTLEPATDLGYLLHKNPARAQTFSLGVGAAHVFYPEATQRRCTAALLLEVDPVGLCSAPR